MARAEPAPPSRRATIVGPLVVLVVLASASGAAFLSTRSVVDRQERERVRSRAGEVALFLQEYIGGTQATLTVLGALSDTADHGGGSFRSAATPALGEASAIGALVPAPTGGGFVVANAVGDTPVGSVLDADLVALARRAALTKNLVSARINGGTRGPRLVLMQRAAGGIVYYETPVVEAPLQQSANTPFADVRAAVYVGPVPDPKTIVIRTVAKVDKPYVDEKVAVGDDTWLVRVGAGAELVGGFAHALPNLLLAGGLAGAFLLAGLMWSLVRRRLYALQLVERRTADLRRTERQLLRVVTVGPTVVVGVDSDSGEIAYVSPNAERLLGLAATAESHPGILLSHLRPADAERLRVAIGEVRETRGSSTIEVPFRWGETTEWRYVSILVTDEDHTEGTGGTLAYILDITDRRRAEDAQRAAMVSQRAAMVAAETANRSKSVFLSRMSHELRTPLNAVLGFGDLLSRDHLNESQEEAVAMILRGGRHLLELINDVLDIATIEAGELVQSPEPVGVEEVASEVVALLGQLAVERGVTVTVELPDQPGAAGVHVHADRRRLRQVLLNLVSNGIKYNRPDGTVTVGWHVTDDGSRVRIDVRDTGPGIAAENLDALFTPFDRIGAERTDVEGAGIGLSLVQRLVEAMNGTVSVETAVGAGSTFSVELARGGLAKGFQDALHVGARPAATPPETGGAPRRVVLHVEDNPSNQRLVERVLAERPVDVVTVSLGREALARARDVSPALVIVDLHLPDIDGEEVIRRLRADAMTASTPVLVITADATPGLENRLVDAGAAGVMTKPIEVDRLLAVVDRCLAMDPT